MSNTIPSSPDIAALKALAPTYDIAPVWETFVDDCETPVSAFLKLRSVKPCFLLESGDHANGLGRYSFLGFNPHKIVRWSLGDTGDPYELAKSELSSLRQAPVAGLPGFLGGAVGFFGYDLVRTKEPLGDPNPDPVGLPDMALMFSDSMVIFDHLRQETIILSQVDLRGDIEANFDSARNEIAAIRDKLLTSQVPNSTTDPSTVADMNFESNMSRETFEGMVSTIIEYVFAGDAFQVVPSQRWSAKLSIDPFSVYRGLRAINPSPYMYFLDFGDFQIAGTSPEPLVKVTVRNVMTYPIAGTRKRGSSTEEDEQLSKELLANEKECAEHLMLVDLARNDIGQIAEYGSVSVTEFMQVKMFSHVMHIVSQVDGTLRDGLSHFDALRSVNPVGTLSGAPKVRAMQIIDEIESVKRGGYGGAVGYVSYTGDMDTAVHIRTVVMRDGYAHLQAGGGTVADAVPAAEFEESVAKMSALKAAFELAISQVRKQTNWN